MQPMGSRRLAPKGMRGNGSGGLYGGEVGILYGPGIPGGSFRLHYRKSGGLVTSIGPRMRICTYSEAGIGGTRSFQRFRSGAEAGNRWQRLA